MNDMEERNDIETLALGRVVDRRDCRTDWKTLESAALVDETVWSRLAESLRQDSELRAAAAEMDACAVRIELPSSDAARRGRRVLFRLLPLATTTKIALASAALVLAWIVGRMPPAPEANNAEVLTSHPARERLGELVPVVVERRPTGSGDEVELILMRRYLEREVVPRLFEVGVDENEVPIVQPVWDAGASEIEFL